MINDLFKRVVHAVKGAVPVQANLIFDVFQAPDKYVLTK